MLNRLPNLATLTVLLALCTELDAARNFAAAQEEAAPEASFSVVLLPDTQFYSEKFPDNYIAQTLWIRQQREKDNIKFAIHLGDIVQTPTKESEWENANRAMAILDGVVPYSMVPGNHDMTVKSRDSSLYNKYFSPARYQDHKWYGGHLGETNDNNYCYFEAAGMKFMVISLEFAPRDETLEWAAGVAKKHPEHRVIVATHCYMRTNARDTACATQYKVEGNSGEQIWQKLIRKQPNIFLVVSGHILGVGLQESTNDAGGKVIEMLTDYQGLPRGGNGWLRTLRFVPAENKIQVKAYSPLLKESKDDAKHSFSLDYEMTSTASEGTPQEQKRLAELDAYWAEVSRAVGAGDFDAYKATCHAEGVLVSGSRENSEPLSKALARWKREFDATKSGEVKAGVEFRFSRRIGDDTTAHETGIFRYSTVDGEGQRRDEYIHFEGLLIKKEGRWQILMEFQKEKAEPAEWKALGDDPKNRR